MFPEVALRSSLQNTAMCPNLQRYPLIPPVSSLICRPYFVKRGQLNVAQNGS
jgi:hypothetical protein